MTDISALIGKDLSIEVSPSVDLHVKVLNENQVEYQFVSTDDGIKDEAVVVNLEVAYDDIDHVEDYYFTDRLGLSRFFMFQFA